jgi:hypothetical protein
MTDIEAKALALLNEVRAERWLNATVSRIDRDAVSTHEALCRAVEQHEAFKQKVSDAVESFLGEGVLKNGFLNWANNRLADFIIPKPKPDPLVDVVARLGWGSDYVPVVRATLDFFDLEIREKGQ